MNTCRSKDSKDMPYIHPLPGEEGRNPPFILFPTHRVTMGRGGGPPRNRLASTTLLVGGVLVLAGVAMLGWTSVGSAMETGPHRTLLFSLEYDPDACEDVNDRPDECAYVRDVCSLRIGYFNYLRFYYCETPHHLRWLTFTFLVFWLGILCYLVANTAARFFCPTLWQASLELGMSQSLAGMTLLAFGNGFPDVLSSFIAVSRGARDVGVAAALGGAVLVATVVLGFVHLVGSASVPFDTFSRDAGLQCLAVIAVILVAIDGKVYLYESILLIVAYVTYLIIVAVWTARRRRTLEARRRSLGVVTQPSRELMAIYAEGGAAAGSTTGIAIHADKSDDAPTWETLLITSLAGGPEGVAPHLVKQDSLLSDVGGPGGVEGSGDVSEDISTSEVPARPRRLKAPLIPPDSLESMLLAAYSRFILHLRWRERGILKKLFYFVEAPLLFIRSLTIPMVVAGNWNRFFVVCAPTLAPLVYVLAFEAFTKTLPGTPIPLCVPVILVGLVASYIVFRTTRDDETPGPRYIIGIFIFSFIMSLTWLWLIVQELIGLLRCLALVLNIHQHILGMTILAWGNSLGDLASNIVFAREGFTALAFAACFGAPAFILLLGLGITFTAVNIANYPDPVEVDIDSSLIVGAIFLCGATAASLVLFPLMGYRTSKRFGILLLLLYFVLITFTLIDGFGWIMQSR